MVGTRDLHTEALKTAHHATILIRAPPSIGQANTVQVRIGRNGGRRKAMVRMHLRCTSLVDQDWVEATAAASMVLDQVIARQASVLWGMARRVTRAVGAEGMEEALGGESTRTESPSEF